MTIRARQRATALTIVVGLFAASCGSAGGELRAPKAPKANDSATDEVVDRAADGGALGDAGATVNVESTGEVPEGFATAEITLVGADGEPRVLSMYVADTPEKQQRGLMEVTDLAGHDGMIFIFDSARENGFWMKDTPTPLTITYFAPDGTVVDILDMEPCVDSTERCPSYPPSSQFQYAVEVFQGLAEELGFTEAARLDLSTLP